MNITRDRIGISKFPHTILQPFMITTRLHLSHLKKILITGARPEAVVQRFSVKKVILRNLTKFTGKHMCQSFFLKKVAGLRNVNFAKFHQKITFFNRALMGFCSPKFKLAKFLTDFFWGGNLWIFRETYVVLKFHFERNEVIFSKRF